jgi:hypothetical protein
MAKTEAWLRDGQPQFVGDGAVAQQGSKKLYRCLTCGGPVVWLESKKTQKVYLASVYKGESSSYYISKPHDCAAALRRREEHEAHLLQLEAKRAEELARPSQRERFLARRAEIVAEMAALEKDSEGVAVDAEAFDHLAKVYRLMTRLVEIDQLEKEAAV